jgi:TatD DNase family protein
MQLFDTHAHLYDAKLVDRLDEVLQLAAQHSVTRMIAVGCSAGSSRQCIEIASQHAGVFASVGVQPNYCHEALEGDWEAIVEMCEDPNVVALGESGLDLYWKDCPFELQQDYFGRHWKLSLQTGLPVIIHTRECEAEMVRDLSLHATESGGQLHGVMHSFCGDWATAKACLDLGLYISFAGMVTYKNAQSIRDVAAQIPIDRLLIETDSPYLSPEPKRSHRPNEPALVLHTAECLARVRECSLIDIAEATTANALRLFQRAQ